MSSDYKDYGWLNEGATDAHAYIIPVLKKVLGHVKGPILDIGCGNGWVTRRLLDEGYDMWGVDASKTGIDLANQHAPGRFFMLNIKSGVLPSALVDKKFKTIISTEVIEHLYDPRGFVAFVKKILTLSGGGRFIVSTPYHGYLKNLALAVIGKMDAHYTVLWDGGHIKFFSRKTLEEMLREQNFCVTSFYGAGRFPWLWKSMVISAEA